MTRMLALAALSLLASVFGANNSFAQVNETWHCNCSPQTGQVIWHQNVDILPSISIDIIPGVCSNGVFEFPIEGGIVLESGCEPDGDGCIFLLDVDASFLFFPSDFPWVNDVYGRELDCDVAENLKVNHTYHPANGDPPVTFLAVTVRAACSDCGLEF